MRRRFSLAAAVALAFAAPAMADDAPFYSKNLSGNWFLGCYAGDKAAFSHCSLITRFQAKTDKQKRTLRASEMYFSVSVHDSMKTWTFALASAQWALDRNRPYNIVFRFGNGHSYSFRASAVDLDVASTLISTLAISKAALIDFMQAPSFRIEINGSDVGLFNLTGSADGLKELFASTAQYSSHEGGGENTFPSASTF